jgi:VanZ family protein
VTGGHAPASAVSGREFLARYGWLLWAPVILLVSVVPVAWVFGATPHATWSSSSELGHFFEFGLFAALVALSRERAAAGSRPALAGAGAAALRVGAAAAVAYGVAIELIQWPIPYRSGDPRDVVVDVLGVACASAILWQARRRAAAAGGGGAQRSSRDPRRRAQ